MNRIDRFREQHSFLAWSILAIAAMVVGLIIGDMTRISAERQRSSLLQKTVWGAANEISAFVMNGPLIGAIATTGMVDISTGHVGKDNVLLGKIAQAIDADGIFVTNRDGIIHSAWSTDNKPTIGMNISDQPYYREAINNRNAIHVTVSPSSGERAIHFSMPLQTTASKPVGTLTIRNRLQRLNTLLGKHADLALLLSPQGLVFASTREDWIGLRATPGSFAPLAETPVNAPIDTPLKKAPVLELPMQVSDDIVRLEGKRYALARSDIHWNDPSGPWRLVLGEDLSNSTSFTTRFGIGLIGAFAIFLLGAVSLNILHQQNIREANNRQMQRISEHQESQALIKTKISEASLRFQQTSSIEELTHHYLDTAHTLLNVLQGSVYLVSAEDAKQLRKIAGFGCSPHIPNTVQLGEGLLGECAQARKALFIANVKPEYWMIASVFCENFPQEIALLPILRQDQLLGAVELAPLHAFDADERAILDELTMLLSLNLEIHLRYAKTQQLLDETRWQTHEMQQQATEIERSARELASQQEETKATEAWYHSIIESAPNGMMVVDKNGLIILANTALETLFKYAPGELIGHPVEILVPESIRAQHVLWRENALAEPALKAMNQRPENFHGIRKDGSEFSLEIGLSPLPAVGGRGSCLCASVRDIAEKQCPATAPTLSEVRPTPD